MSDALSLPPRPNIEQYRKLARDFQIVCKSGDAGAVREWAASWAETLARLRGDSMTTEVRSEIGRDTERVERRWRGVYASDERAARCTLADAQFFIAQCHGFASWPKFVKHLEALAGADSTVAQFELAVNSIVAGDIRTLEKLLRDDPDLVQMRSTREHRSTLLHYVSANGVEDFRQKTPKNIIEVTRLLLNAGADVNAESGAYGGGSTTLGLTATSYHPQAAGVQLELMDLLVRSGAMIDPPGSGSAVNDCLRNGRGEAAAFFADRGARLDLEGAAGVGRLDVVRSFFKDDGTLTPPATAKQMMDGFAWACEFGRASVVDLLVQRGMKVDTRLPHNGQTGLHWAAFGGHADTVKLLLARGASAFARDKSFEGTPLDWALYGWGSHHDTADRRYYEVVALLARSGARLDDAWFEGDDEDRLRAIRKLRSEPGMQAALRGDMPQ